MQSRVHYTLSILLSILSTKYSLNQLLFSCFELFRQHSKMTSLSLLKPEWIYKMFVAHSNLFALISH